jgi:sugar phosphate isomerase/epimerase
MIRSAVTVSLVPEVRGGPFIFWDDLATACHSARALGFDAIEIFPPSADGVDAEEVRRLLDAEGLALAAVGTGAGWVRHRLSLTAPEAPVREAACTFIRSIIDLAGSFGAPAIIGSMQGRHDGVKPELAWLYLQENLAKLSEHAKQYEVPLLYEPLNRYETNLCNTLQRGGKLLRDIPNARLLADLFHMNIEEDHSAQAIRDTGLLIGHVHFVDSNRKPAGCGQMDYQPIAQALAAIGYGGYLSAEAFAWPDPVAAARVTMKTFQTYFR